MTFATFAFDWFSCLRTPTAFSISFFPCFSCTTAFSIFFFACCSCLTAFYYTHCETSEKTPEINKKLHKKLSDTTINYFCGLWPPVSGSSSGSSGHFVSHPSWPSCFCWCRASTWDLRLLFHLSECSPVRTGWSGPLLRCRHLRLRMPTLGDNKQESTIRWTRPIGYCTESNQRREAGGPSISTSRHEAGRFGPSMQVCWARSTS